MRQCFDVVYWDFSKAFYRVSHVKLLFNLECLGVKCSLLGWFRSYSRPGRRHRVVIDNESSDFLLVTSGVPQKSILGPLLFSVLINDMPKVIWRETSLPLFADDYKCFRLILGQDDCDNLQDELNDSLLLVEWSSMLKSVRFWGWHVLDPQLIGIISLGESS